MRVILEKTHFFWQKVSLLALTMSLLFSCVGTIEEKNPIQTKAGEVGDQAIPFAGLVSATPISDSKVVLKFAPSPGNAKDLTYLIYINNTDTPIQVKGEGLRPDLSGLLSYTVGGLRINTNYSFSVGVRNGVTGQQSNANTTLNAKTFSNFTADFEGISSVRPASGLAGASEVVIEWIPAVTRGSTLPRANDPVGYEIRYMKASDGGPELLLDANHPAVTPTRFPNTINDTTMISKERSRTISGLDSATRYYFLVRAIHHAYTLYGENDPNYKLEENIKILSTETLDLGGTFSWSPTNLTIEATLGEESLTKIDVRWAPATGPYEKYRLFYIKIAEPDATESDLDAVSTPFDFSDIQALTSSGDYEELPSGTEFKRLTNLDTLAYYKLAVVACRTPSCNEETDLILGETSIRRIVPVDAPFSGVLNILDPRSLSELEQDIGAGTGIETIRVTFDAPVISSGYVNKMELYCFDGFNDPSPTLIPYDVAPTYSGISAATSSTCDELVRVTATPGTLSGIGSFTEISVRGNFIKNGSKSSDSEYCFGVIPVIEFADYVKRDIANAVIRCKTIRSNPPTLEDFPGANKVCDPGATSLNVTWPEPKNGLYSNFRVFWKEVSADNPVFLYSEAIGQADPTLAADPTPAYPNDLGYSMADVDGSTLEYEIPNLTPGKRYSYGVLTYYGDENNPTFSEFNSGTQTCEVPLPQARFDEWVDIFAVGPKVDGRAPRKDGTGARTFMFETVYDDGQILEVDVDASFQPTSAFLTQFYPDGLPDQLSNSARFDGVFGRANGSSSNPQQRFSNTGIVRLMWKDVDFPVSAIKMNDLIADSANFSPDYGDGSCGDTTSDTTVNKNCRLFGYRVYRSVDQGKNWVDLTSENYPYQTTGNAGLIHPKSYSEKPRLNAAADTFNIGEFIDYSVQYAELDNPKPHIDRAREYYYKIVPVFNGQELVYEREADNPQNIIRVVLPPPNMGLVNRLMANRQTCMEMGKAHVKDIRKHYTCDYNGVGAKGKSNPWVVGETHYDFGGSVLMDRFEMGCDYTRGDQGNQRSVFDAGDNGAFKGAYENGGSSGPFRGCLLSDNASSVQTISSTITDPTAPFESHKVWWVGDCIGTSLDSIAIQTCSDPDRADREPIMLPGFYSNTSITQDCTDPYNTIDNLTNPWQSRPSTYYNNVAQSEFLATFYHMAAGPNGSYITNLGNDALRGNGTSAVDTLTLNKNRRTSRCMINIPVEDKTDSDTWKPRWVGVNDLDDFTHNNAASESGFSGNPMDIYNTTVGQLKGLTQTFFSIGGANALPDGPSGEVTNYVTSPYYRYTDDTPIAAVFSSNNAKLPPLDGINQEQARKICGAYEVQVGYEVDGSFNTLETHKKRLMRRTEGIVAAAPPKQYDINKVTDIEDGNEIYTPSAANGGSNFNPSCNVYQRENPGGTAVGSSFEAGMPIRSNMTTTKRDDTNFVRSAYITGSSFNDFSSRWNNTQECTSRFGMQDLIGNVAEYSSENIYCDFSGETLYFGQDGVAGNSLTLNQFDSSLSGVSDRLYDPAGIEAWVQSNTNTGRCSMVEYGSDRSYAASQGGVMTPSFDLFGNLNDDLIQIPLAEFNKGDPNNILDWRNGDGYYLDFGQGSLAPPLSDNDTMALRLTGGSVDGRVPASGDPRQGSYFNPVIGLPLMCDATSCTETPDNRSVTLCEWGDLNDDGDCADPDEEAAYSVVDFPILNSNIWSDGMSETFSSRVYTFPINREGSISYAEAVNTDGSGNSPDTFTTIRTEDFLTGPSGTELYRTGWLLSRDQSLGIYMENFGSSIERLGAGRYSAHMRQRGLEDQEGSNRETGFRCVIKLDEVKY